jgi:H/ACA ribonucleoprotein complex subunit 4
MSYRHFILVDKTSGITSSQLVQAVKRIFKARKAGHIGTLDTNTTGLIIVGLDEALKAMPLLDRVDKEYEGTMTLHKDIDRDELVQAIGRFTGSIEQTPPRRSAVKREPRTRRVFSFRILESTGRRVLFRTRVEAGTYIRKLCHDIGKTLNTSASMDSLRRISIGNIPVSDSKNLDDLESDPKKAMIKIEGILDRIGTKKIIVKEEVLDKIRTGTPLDYSDLKGFDKDLKPNERAGIFNPKGEILALGKLKEEPAPGKRKIIKIDRVLNTKP